MTVLKSKTFNSFFYFALLGMVLFSLGSCQSKYDRTVKKEMASGKRIDSLQFNLYFGDSKKDFFAKCWELNKKGLIKQGPKNQYVAYELKGTSETAMTHLFYGIFNEEKQMVGLDMEFTYDGWSPWTEKLQSDKLLFVAMDTLKKWYPGNDFFLLENSQLKTPTYVKIDGNRQIIIHAQGDKDVKATLEDLRHKFPALK